LLRLSLIAVFLCSFTASAAALPPLKQTVWVKASAAWSAQAKAHGATATCTPWNAAGVLPMGCDFGPRGKVSLSWTGAACSYNVNVAMPRPGMPATFLTTKHATLNFCTARWWTKPLPAPWSSYR